jgi:hypothetical protein
MQGGGGSQRRQARPAGEPRAVGGRPDGSELNRDRLIFCLSSLIGHRVTATLRNNVMYDGIFHSCSLDNDYSITLKCARRLPSEANNRSGEIVHTLVIPGKDFLQVSAEAVSPPCSWDGRHAAGSRRGFATDGEISKRSDAHGNRELVPWQADQKDWNGLEDASSSYDPKWDQFAANEKMYGISSTYSEDLYTTKLDRSNIPEQTRAEADRIAREIEAGQMHSEVENRLDGDGDDEEAKFAAAAPSGGQSTSSQPKETKALSRQPLPQVPERRDADSLSGLGSDRQRQRGMISEMKRINALNLEPTSSKHDDSSSRSRMSKDAQARNTRLAPNPDLKSEFQQSLNLIAQQQASKQSKQQQQQQAANAGTAGAGQDGNWQGQAQQGMMMQRKDSIQASGGAGAYPKNAGGGLPSKSSFSFNPQAKAFSLNPQAGEFTPSGATSGATGGGGASVAKAAPSHSASFNIYKKSPDLVRKSLVDTLEPFFHRAKSSTPDSASPDWPDAKGPSYRDVLGQPNPNSRPQMQMMPGGPGPGGPQMPMAMAGGWQPQAQHMMQMQMQPQQQPAQQPNMQQQNPQHQVQQQGGPPSQDQSGPPMGGMGVMPGMMQQGFVMANAQPGGAPNQMYGQMYAPGGCPTHQGGGTMPPNAIVFNQSTMMGQGGSQMVPMGMVAHQGQNPQMGMGPMPKFGGQQQQMVVMPVMLAGPGQYQAQAFLPMQGQGMQVPQGGPPHNPPQAGH